MTLANHFFKTCAACSMDTGLPLSLLTVANKINSDIKLLLYSIALSIISTSGALRWVVRSIAFFGVTPDFGPEFAVSRKIPFILHIFENSSAAKRLGCLTGSLSCPLEAGNAEISHLSKE